MDYKAGDLGYNVMSDSDAVISRLKGLIEECADGLAMCSHGIKDVEFRKQTVALFKRARFEIWGNSECKPSQQVLKRT
jgi:hypothetical protein